MPIDSTNVAPPEHPLPRLATFELTRYRRELERALKRLPTPDDLTKRVFRGTAENQLPDVRWPKIMAGMDH